jgi:hypothetical protein
MTDISGGGITPQLLTPEQAAQLVDERVQVVMDWIANDRIPYVTTPAAPGEPEQYRIPLQGFINALSDIYDLDGELEALYSGTNSRRTGPQSGVARVQRTGSRRATAGRRQVPGPDQKLEAAAAFVRTYGIDHVVLAAVDVMLARRNERKGHSKRAKLRLVSAGMRLQLANIRLVRNAVIPRIADKRVAAQAQQAFDKSISG